MTSTERIDIPSSDPDHVVQIPLFDYVKKLDVKVRERYLKISTIGIDTVLIGGKRFEPDCLPLVVIEGILAMLIPLSRPLGVPQLKIAHKTIFYPKRNFWSRV